MIKKLYFFYTQTITEVISVSHWPSSSDRSTGGSTSYSVRGLMNSKYEV